jgi:uncharacterized membrane protein
VAVSPALAFTTTIEPASISNLRPWASAPVTLTVAIPPTAPEGTRETARVTVTSDSDPTLIVTATLTTTAAYTLLLLLMFRP